MRGHEMYRRDVTEHYTDGCTDTYTEWFSRTDTPDPDALRAALTRRFPADDGFREALTLAVQAWTLVHRTGPSWSELYDVLAAAYPRLGPTALLDRINRAVAHPDSRIVVLNVEDDTFRYVWLPDHIDLEAPHGPHCRC